MDVTVTVKGAEEVAAKARRKPSLMRTELGRLMVRLSLELFGIVQRKLHGEVLRVQTGLLSQSQSRRVREEGDEIAASVGFNRRTVPYGLIHETGGRTPPHIIRPRRALALAFPSARSATGAAAGAKMVFAKVVHHPGSKMPQRSFLRSSLDELHPSAMGRIEAMVETVSRQ